jgi:hypothetical protein
MEDPKKEETQEQELTDQEFFNKALNKPITEDKKED